MKEKKIYISPDVQFIAIDKIISIAMLSEDDGFPTDPGGGDFGWGKKSGGNDNSSYPFPSQSEKPASEEVKTFNDNPFK